MKTWHVQPGDTLYRIALSHGVPLSELLVANPGLDPNNLAAGQEVVIPDNSGADLTVPSAPAESWVVAPGDTLYSIAQAAGVNLADLIAVNLRQILLICVLVKNCVCPFRSDRTTGNTALPQRSLLGGRARDTLYKIAQATGFTVDEIPAVNPGLTLAICSHALIYVFPEVDCSPRFAYEPGTCFRNSSCLLL